MMSSKTRFGSWVDETYNDPLLRSSLGLQRTVTFESHTNLGKTNDPVSESMEHLSISADDTRTAAPAPRPRDRMTSRKARGKGNRADQFCIYRTSDARSVPAVAMEYKAPHKLSQVEAVTGLASEIQPDRNGLVSVFLRALEYYRGVLFLTTNRVKSFDPAFLSRIHVALHNKNLRDEDRERIWAHNFDRLDRDSTGRVHVSVAAREYVWNNRGVRTLRWNGREIRNAMQTALALAESDAQEENTERIIIAEKHLRAVVKMSRGFRDYIKGSVEMFDDPADDEDSSDEGERVRD